MLSDQPPALAALGLDPAPLPDLILVNRRVAIRDDSVAGLRVILVGGIPSSVYGRGDAAAERVAAVTLVLAGHARRLEVGRAFGIPRRTLHRWIQAYTSKGAKALVPYHPTGRKSLLPDSVVAAIARLHAAGLGMQRISARLGLSMSVVRGVYRREGLQPVNQKAPTLELEPALAAAAEEASRPAQVEPPSLEDETREWCEGWAIPAPESSEAIPRAGALLALPILARLKVIPVVRSVFAGVFGAIPKYGLEVMILVMVLLALWRIRRPENLKEVSPEELGRVLGLERVPEMKTVRSKLARMAAHGGAAEAMRRLAEVRIAQQEDSLGVLYVDGHVRPYSGTHLLAKGYSTQRRQPLPATTEVWANDRRGDPVFVVTTEANQHLTEVLEAVLEQARSIAGERRITVVFDRGGWSPALFVRLIEAGHDLITYRKGAVPDLPLEDFQEHRAEVDGTQLSYHLHDEPEARLTKGDLRWSSGPRRPLVLREVTKLNRETGHQTRVVTTRRDLPAVEVLVTLFARWRQENFFKYMRQEFAIDGLVEYGAQGVDPKLDRPNPERTRIAKEEKALRARIAELQGQRCELIGEPRPSGPCPAGFEKFIPEAARQRALLGEIRTLKGRLGELEAEKAQTPERVSAAGLERLRTGRKQVADLFKMVAYHVETELVELVSPHYARSEDEARTLIAAALSSTASYAVSRGTLTVTLAPQAAPHRSKAIAALCDSLNEEPATTLPGTRLRVRLACPENPA
jgi:transposase